MIKNLRQFRQAMQAHKKFVIVKHYIKPEHTGEVRMATKVQTNCMYTVVPDEPNHPVSKANRGLGFRMEFDTAATWQFTEDTVTKMYYKSFVDKNGKRVSVLEPLMVMKVLDA